MKFRCTFIQLFYHLCTPLDLYIYNSVRSQKMMTQSRLGQICGEKNQSVLNGSTLKAPNSVVYVNFGSITVMTNEQLVEFAWGLANRNMTFLWVIRPDLVAGKSAIVPPEFVEVTKGRSLLTSWCPQEQVLTTRL
ncbi:hypothetical protein M0R45_027528 [Rubus argutus]|uniref:Uncharacterized protein n=1 Tax=Rubus argutus TaxID=59490 RepID=A0AAW1X3B4_RUBAR